MKLWHDEGLESIRATLAAQGHREFFVATETTIHRLRAYAEEHPGGVVFFQSHFHDVLPVYSQGATARAIVPSEQHRALAIASGARGERITVHAVGPDRPAPVLEKIINVVVIAEAHPYGGLVSALALLEQCRLAGARWNIYEHAVPSKEMFLPLRHADIHAFPRRPAEITYTWREHLQVRPAQVDAHWGSDTVFLWMPLHLAPPLTLNVAKVQQEKARLAVIETPWTLQNEWTETFPAAHWKLFDPLRYPLESAVNAGIARGFARRLLRQWVSP